MKISMWAYKQSISLLAIVLTLSSAIMSSATSLEDVIEGACEFHPDIFTAKLDVHQAHEGVQQAKAIVLPRITSISEVGFADDAGEGAAIQSSVQDSRLRSTQLSIDQAIYIGGRGRAAIRGAKYQRDVQWYSAEREILNAQITAIQAYIEVAQAQEILEVRTAELSSLKQRLQESRRRFELGGGTKSDIVQAQARIARNEADIVSAQSDIEQAGASLYEASGIHPSEKLELAALPDVPTNITQALEYARQINPDIKAANSAIDVAGQTVKTVQGDRSPEVRLLGDLNVQRDTSFNGFEREDASLRLRLTVPIFSGGALASRERDAHLAKNSTAYNHLRVVNRVHEGVLSAWSQYQSSQRLIKINEQLVVAAEKASIAVKKEADAGFRANQDTLDAQQELLDAKLALTGAKHNNVFSAYSLLGAIGRLENEKYPKCQNLLPELDPAPKRKIIKKINSIVPGVKIEIPERRKTTGPRSKR